MFLFFIFVHFISERFGSRANGSYLPPICPQPRTCLHPPPPEHGPAGNCPFPGLREAHLHLVRSEVASAVCFALLTLPPDPGSHHHIFFTSPPCGFTPAAGSEQHFNHPGTPHSLTMCPTRAWVQWLGIPRSPFPVRALLVAGRWTPPAILTKGPQSVYVSPKAARCMRRAPVRHPQPDGRLGPNVVCLLLRRRRILRFDVLQLKCVFF